MQMFGPAALEALAFQMLDYQVCPMALPGECLGGSSVLGDSLVQAGERAIAYLKSAGSAELDAVANSMDARLLDFFDLDACKQHEGEEIKRMALYWIGHLVTKRMQKSGLSPLTPIKGGRVWNRFPALQPFFTDEGLLRLHSSLTFDRFGVQFDGHVIHFHPWLGISRSDSPHSDLHAMLCDHAKTTVDTVSIAIDGRCFTPIASHRRVHVKDHWYGRPFSRQDLDDEYATGVTVHTAPDLGASRQTAAQCTIRGIQRTEFFWKHKERIKTFEAEEVMTSDRSDRGRYLHSEYDLDARSFRHLDGAAMVYSASDGKRRSQLTCVRPNVPKANAKPKLFRIDGDISVTRWSLALCLFFRGNPLVHEYLDGKTGPSVTTH